MVRLRPLAPHPKHPRLRRLTARRNVADEVSVPAHECHCFFIDVLMLQARAIEQLHQRIIQGALGFERPDLPTRHERGIVKNIRVRLSRDDSQRIRERLGLNIELQNDLRIRRGG